MSETRAKYVVSTCMYIISKNFADPSPTINRPSISSVVTETETKVATSGGNPKFVVDLQVRRYQRSKPAHINRHAESWKARRNQHVTAETFWFDVYA